jgi:hypothetical protein
MKTHRRTKSELIGVKERKGKCEDYTKEDLLANETGYGALMT